MAPIHNVPKEVIAKIVQLVADSSPNSLTSLSSVNRVFHELVKYRRHHTLNIRGYSLYRINGPDMWAAVRLVKIPDGVPVPDDLSKCIQDMTGLRDVEFRITYESSVFHIMPSDDLFDFFGVPSKHSYRYIAFKRLMDAIAGRPNIRLHFQVTMFDAFTEGRFFKLLMDNKNLSTLDIDHSFETGKHCKTVTEPLRELVLSCSNLRKLKLNIYMPDRFDGLNQYCGMNLKNGERPPALETLELVSYPFGIGGKDIYEDTDHFFIGYESEGREQEYWSNTFDWTQLKQCSTFDLTIFSGNLHKLQSLDELTILGNPDTQAMTEFLNDIPCVLKKISLPCLPSNGIDCILRHGSRLRSLCIHRVVKGTDVWSSPLTKEDLKRLREACPLIDTLAIDIRQSISTELELSRFPELVTLSLFYNFTPEETGDYFPPDFDHQFDASDPMYCENESYVTVYSSKLIFESLRMSSPAQPSRLKELTVGSLGSEYHALAEAHNPTRHSREQWVLESATIIKCTLSDRDDEAALNFFTITAPNLAEDEHEAVQESNRYNVNALTILKRPRDDDRKPPTRVTPGFKYAVHGPLRWDHWKLYKIRKHKAHGLYLRRKGLDEI
ncbi:hypothetical protein GGR52DRAFT_591462 [Hypoxylon sp. FL1284]|nr:hypothetical protein GGR52DRAFT_591462 [Hypoxylon sp. FL1284]